MRGASVSGGALAGLRVIDMSRILAGPLCAMMLGDHGADVVKVESPEGDDTRRFGPPFVGNIADAPDGYVGESAYYLSANRNKRGIVIDLSRAEGQELALRLLDGADVLVENFKPGTLERWGLEYDTVLRRRNPRLVQVTVSGFGPTGPYAGVPGYDIVGQAMGGLISVTGEPDSGPTRVGVAIADLAAALYATQGVLLAIAARARSGVGQRVDCSLLESVVGLLWQVASDHLVGGVTPRRYGNAHPTVVPYQLFGTADGVVYIAVANDRQFAKLMELLGAPTLAADARFRTNADRVVNRAVLIPLLEPLFVTRSTADWIERCWTAGVPAAPIHDIPQVFADPQVLHREMLASVAHPTIPSGVRMVGIPVKLRDTPGRVVRHPPLLGEHTRDVLREAGLGDADIALLEDRGVVRTWSGRRASRAAS